jgi:hypothetical protein
MRSRSYTDEEVREAVASSQSYRSALQKLGLVPAGSNYATLKQTIDRLQVDTSHFLGQGHHRGRKLGPRRSLGALLALGSTVQSYKLERRILAEKLLPHRCMDCGRRVWRGWPIPLELHHRDGDRSNNTLANLRLLCPNCHALTETYRGRNIRR